MFFDTYVRRSSYKLQHIRHISHQYIDISCVRLRSHEISQYHPNPFDLKIAQRRVISDNTLSITVLLSSSKLKIFLPPSPTLVLFDLNRKPALQAWANS